MKVYLFRSKSNPAAPPHRTTVYEDGTVTCTCPGFAYRQVCVHVTDVRQGLVGYTENTPVESKVVRAIMGALEDEYEEGAIEAALEAFPSMSRHEAVDLVDEIERHFQNLADEHHE